MRFLKAAVVTVAAAAAFLWLSHLPATYLGAGTQSQPATYALPSPSYWPLSPYPTGVVRVEPTPQVTVSPCPTWAPTLIDHGGWFECKAYIPPDPKTGPLCSRTLQPPIVEPDGTLYCP